VTQALTEETATPAKEPKQDLSHDWIVAAEIHIDPRTAKRAFLRHSYIIPKGKRIHALEVYCKNCRRPYDDVADKVCSAKVNNEHLIGGDQSVRAKRKIPTPPPGARPAAAPAIDRRGSDRPYRL